MGGRAQGDREHRSERTSNVRERGADRSTQRSAAKARQPKILGTNKRVGRLPNRRPTRREGGWNPRGFGPIRTLEAAHSRTASHPIKKATLTKLVPPGPRPAREPHATIPPMNSPRLPLVGSTSAHARRRIRPPSRGPGGHRRRPLGRRGRVRSLRPCALDSRADSEPDDSARSGDGLRRDRGPGPGDPRARREEARPAEGPR